MRHCCRIACALLFAFTLAAEAQQQLDGFSAESSRRQIELEARLKETILPTRIEEHLQWLTSRPHRTGTDGAKLTADYLLQQLKDDGFEAEMIRYDAYLPAPVSVSIELTQPVAEKIPTTEEKIEGDPFTDFVNDHPGWNGYSPSGEATGQVVYAHYGSTEDLQQLKNLGIDLKGKILLMRYFGTGEGRKVRNAEEAGAAAVVLYSDPAEDGFRYGDVYPKGDWRPPGSIMRRSIVLSDGDPLTPGWASVAGAKRLKPEEAGLPRIPVLPISYRSAERILSFLNGPVAPYEWQGALGLTYHVGAGPAEVHLRTEMDNRDRPIWNVIGRLTGSAYPDQWVTLGNHHDAWIFGAGDPSSGTAALLTLAEALGKLAREGTRPKRTILVTFWDAEEMILGGSTEWVEDHERELLDKAVACINMDSAVFNTERPLSVAAHPVLHTLFRSAARNIQDPRSGRTLFEVWRDLQNKFRNVPGVDGWGDYFDPSRELKEPYVFEAPSDDAAPFFNFLALPASDMYYGADYGMYHSIYENFHWMKTVVDPTFEYHKVMALLQGFVGLRLANADLLPLDYAMEASYWRMAFRDLEQKAKARNQNPAALHQALMLIDQWEREALRLTQTEKQFLKTHSRVKPEFNRSLYLVSRDFRRSAGKKDRPDERNLFTGLSDADKEIPVYIAALQKRVRSLQALRKQMAVAGAK